MLKASVGFGGSCFKKDVLCLVYIADSLHLPEVASYWKSIVDINEYQKDRFTKRIISRLFNSLTNKKIALLGFAYKKNTADTRESAAITVMTNLAAEGARISIYDPKVKEDQIYQDLELSCTSTQEYWQLRPNVNVCSDVYEACEGAHAVVVLTEWDEFSNKPVKGATGCLDWAKVAEKMQRPMFVFDGRNILDVPALENLGFRAECIGKSGHSNIDSGISSPNVMPKRGYSPSDMRRKNTASSTNWSTPGGSSDSGSRRDSNVGSDCSSEAQLQL
jgi:UDPglucose 6-dehydrogenase